MIVLAALATCFKPNELHLTLDQLMVRGFAPTESYGKQWIADFLARKIIKAELLSGTRLGEDVAKTILIRSPAGANCDIEGFKITLSNKLMRLINSDFQYSLYLKEFIIDIAACECIEYACYYANKSHLSISNASYTYPRLRLLLLECEQKQVFMLIWRAIKHVAGGHSKSVTSVEFVEIIDNALSCYVKYKKKGLEIESYNPPQFMKPSALADFIGYLTVAKENYLDAKILK